MTKTRAPELSEPLMSVADLATFLGVPVATIYAWRTDGRGPRGIRIGRHVKFAHSDVHVWLDRQRDPLRSSEVS